MQLTTTPPCLAARFQWNDPINPIVGTTNYSIPGVTRIGDEMLFEEDFDDELMSSLALVGIMSVRLSLTCVSWDCISD